MNVTKQDVLEYFRGESNAGNAMNEYIPSEALPDVGRELVDSYGGEDCGSTYYTVWKFTLEDGTEFYLRFDGWYASHYGCDYHDFHEVHPKQVTKTEYV